MHHTSVEIVQAVVLFHLVSDYVELVGLARWQHQSPQPVAPLHKILHFTYFYFTYF